MNNNIKKYIIIIIMVIIMIFLVSKIHAKIILVSFDGSGYFDMWEQTLLFAKDHEEEGLKFTYFVSAPYFITEQECKEYPYWALSELKVKPYCKIQKDENINSVIRRRMYTKIAMDNGHEIASHLCGHYDGKNWTYEQWTKEMEFFRWAMNKAGIDNKKIIGIRVPYLSTNEAYFKALKNDGGYEYDSSKGWNKKIDYTADVEIPIKSINVVYLKGGVGDGTVGWTLPFDDAFQVFINNKFIKGIKNKEIEDIYFDSLCYEYLDIKDYYPLQICLHFEQINNGAYYNAMVRFVEWVEDKGPIYMTYKEYMEEMK